MSMKEVRFDLYCNRCKHYEKSEAEDPCWDCLDQNWNDDSHKPINFEEGGGGMNNEPIPDDTPV